VVSVLDTEARRRTDRPHYHDNSLSHCATV